MKHQYTHPQPDPELLMRYYRRFLMSLKKRWTGDRPRQSPSDRKARPGPYRALRAHTHYLGYVTQYLAAKALVFDKRNQKA